MEWKSTSMRILSVSRHSVYYILRRNRKDGFSNAAVDTLFIQGSKAQRIYNTHTRMHAYICIYRNTVMFNVSKTAHIYISVFAIFRLRKVTLEWRSSQTSCGVNWLRRWRIQCRRITHFQSIPFTVYGYRFTVVWNHGLRIYDGTCSTRLLPYRVPVRNREGGAQLQCTGKTRSQLNENSCWAS